MRLLAVLLTLLASACVLFVGDNPDSIGPNCRFDGMETECGKCIAASCQMLINDCCVKSGCRDRSLADVDACASGTSSKCSTYDLDDGIASCIAANCAMPCLKESTSCTNGTFQCSCNLSPTPNKTQCTQQTVHNGVCCAGSSWPSSGASCSCEVFGCDDQGSSCFCSLHSFSGNYVDSCSGTHCCASSTSCRCGSSACFSNETEVMTCTADAIGCGSGQKRVAGCSL